MMFKIEKLVAVVALAAVLGATGCANTVISEATQAAWEDRLAEDQIVDMKIKSGIVKRWSGRDKNLPVDVNADVWEQRVMLTGVLDNAKERTAVVALANQDKRIKIIHSMIQIVTAEQKELRRKQAENKDSGDKRGFGQAVSDFWIETKIKAKLLTKSEITSVNYRWRSVLNKIYIIGRAKSSKELDDVLDIVRQTEGVKSIKHFIRIIPVAGS